MPSEDSDHNLNWALFESPRERSFFMRTMNFDQIAPASVDQLNARPTSYQEVAGSTLAVLATFFRGD